MKPLRRVKGLGMRLSRLVTASNLMTVLVEEVEDVGVDRLAVSERHGQRTDKPWMVNSIVAMNLNFAT